MADTLFDYCPKGEPKADSEEIDAQLAEIAKKGQSISMMNYYSEMPIISRTTISIIDKGKIEVTPKDIHLEVLSQQQKSFVTLPNGECLLAECHAVYPGKGFAVMARFCYVKIHAGLRESLRVGFERPINVFIDDGERKIPSMLRNISLGGGCVTMFVRDLEPGRELVLHLKSFDNEAQQIDQFSIKSILVRVDHEKPPFACGLRFELDKNTEADLANYINRRQLSIIKQLKEMK